MPKKMNMPKIIYTVTIERSSLCEFKVEASSEQEAEDLAMQEAYDRNWAMDDADYYVEDVSK